MRILMLALSLILMPFIQLQAAESWENDWIFAERPIYLDQLYDACNLLNDKTDKVSCYPDNSGVVVSFFTKIDNAAIVDKDIAEIRYNVNNLYSFAMRSGLKIRVIDRSTQPYMTALYGFKMNTDNYNGRLNQESYSELNKYCKSLKITDWYCSADKPDMSWIK